MKRILFLFLLSALSLHAETIQGDVKLNYSDSMFAKNSFKKEFGTAIKATASWYAGEFFGEETVFAGVTVKNTSTKPMSFYYYVAFYDKDKKLIGATGQGAFGDSGLKPGEETQMASCMIHLPKDKYKEIVSYQVVMYESDTPPKKK